jgi:hypothetical protein
VWSNVLDLEGDNIAAAQLAVDGEVKQRQVAFAVCDLKFGCCLSSSRNRESIMPSPAGCRDTVWKNGRLRRDAVPILQPRTTPRLYLRPRL